MKGRRSSGPIRVMYVVPDLRVGGAERHATLLLPLLDRERFTPSLVCIGEEGELFPDLAAGGVPAVSLGLTKRDAPKAIVGLVREMRRLRPEIVLTRGYNAELLGRVAAVIARVPHSVVWVHNNSDIEPRTKVRQSADRLLDRVTTAYYGVAHGQIAYMRDHLKYPASKIRVIYNGADPAAHPYDPAEVRDEHLAASFGITPAQFVVGIVAVLRPEKDHETFLRAAAVVANERPDVRFLIVGDGPMRASLESLATALGIADAVVFAGSRTDVNELLRLMDVFVLSSYTECCPNSLLEAMANGRAAVCTAVGGIPEMIDEGVTGFLAPPRDADALGQRIVDALSDPEALAAMGRAARLRLETTFSLAQSMDAASWSLEETAGRVGSRTARTQVARVPVTLIMDTLDVGGAERSLLNMLATIDRERFSPSVICLRSEGSLATEFRERGIPVQVLSGRGPSHLGTLSALTSALRAIGTKVVLLFTHRAPMAFGRLAARRVGAATVIAVHGMGGGVDGDPNLPPLVRSSAILTDVVVVLAASQLTSMQNDEGFGRSRWSTSRVVQIPNGVVLPPAPTAEDRARGRALLGIPSDGVVAGIVAALRPEKSHERLIAAVARAGAERPNLRLVIIGGGPREAELKALAAASGIGDRIHFLGSRPDVPELLPGLDLLCLTSYREALPLSILEGMAVGLPIVSTDVGAISDVVRDGTDGFLVGARDTEMLAQRIGRLADDPDLRSRMGMAGRQRVAENFVLDDVARRYEALFNELGGAAG